MLNSAEEKKIRELKDKCRELGVPSPPEIFIGLHVHDRDGVLVFDDIQRGHSWNRNYYNMMFGYGAGAYTNTEDSINFGAGYITSRDSLATISSYAGRTVFGGGYAVGHNYINNLAGDDSFGIQIGTGSTAFNANDYILATKILHGITSGKMSYQAMVASAIAYTAGTKTWASVISRIFNNNSGESITVAETGLMYEGVLYGNGGKFLIERSVLSPAVAVANGAQLTVTYSIEMDFSAID